MTGVHGTSVHICATQFTLARHIAVKPTPQNHDE